MEIFHPARTPLEAYVREPKPSSGWTLEIRPARGRSTPAADPPVAPPAAAPKKVEEENPMRVRFSQVVCFRGQDMRPGQEIECPENIARALEFRKLACIVPAPVAVAPVVPAPVPALSPPVPEPAPVPEPPPAIEVPEPDPVQAPDPDPASEPEPEPKKAPRPRRSRAKKVS